MFVGFVSGFWVSNLEVELITKVDLLGQNDGPLC
jgi:hypothetical protein